MLFNFKSSTKLGVEKFFLHSIVFYLGILSPGIAFLFMGLGVPAYQEDAIFGVYSFLIRTYYVFAPIIFMATLSFFIIFVLNKTKRIYKWQVISLWAGFFAAIFGLISGFLWQGTGMISYLIFFWTPVGAPWITPVIYWLAARKAQKMDANKNDKSVIYGALINIPFVYAAMIWAHKIQENTPHLAGDRCFVVTATQDVPSIFADKIMLNGNYVTKQLLIIKGGEFFIERNFPYVHVLFRKVYNKIGPTIANAIEKSTVLVIIVYFLLKPIEYLFYFLLKQSKKTENS